MKSNILLAIGISLVVALGALTAFESQHPAKSATQKEFAAKSTES